MKKSTIVSRLLSRVVLICLFAFVCIATANSQVTVSGSTALDGSYSNLGAVFTALNGGGSQVGNSIVVTISSNITETGNDSLAQGDWHKLTINPSGAITVSGNLTTSGRSLINFNGADRVIIDGLNASGNSLTISNTATGFTNTILFRNDASNNKITNCTINGSGTSSINGVIMFGAGTTTGNDNDTVSNCNVAPAGSNLPTNSILSSGTSSTIDNSSILIDNNNIYDYWNAAAASYAINIVSTNANSSNNWTISGNRFYQTARRTISGSFTSYIINIGTGDGATITNNILGYSSSTQTGTYILSTGATLSTNSVQLIAIAVSGTTATTASIQGNTIAAFRDTTAGGLATGVTNAFTGIYIAGTASANIGNVAFNTIGSTSGTASIAMVGSSNQSLSPFPATGVTGIHLATTGSVNVSNNKLGGFSSTILTSSTNTCNSFGIYNTNSIATLTIDNNIVGNTTTNNMVAGTAGSSTVAVGVGIYLVSLSSTGNGSTVAVTNNTVQNFNMFSSSSSTSTFVRGIVTPTASTVGSMNISNNIIHDLTSNSQATTAVSSINFAAQGILLGYGLNPVVSGNTIYNIQDTTNASSASSITVGGIGISSAQNPRVFNNKIYSLKNTCTSVSATAPPVVSGIQVISAQNQDSIYNNMIELGTYGGSSDASNRAMIGIWAKHGTTPDPIDYIFHNTVNIEGTVTSGALNTFCFLRGDLSTATVRVQTVVLKNNIFTNTRTGGTGKHYAIGNNTGYTGATSVLTGWTSDYNILYSSVSTTVGHIGGTGAADKTFATWKSGMSADASSNSVAVTYAASSSGDLHIGSAYASAANYVESRGDIYLGINKDIDAQGRPGPSGSSNGGALAPDLGADEFDGTPQTFSCTTPAATGINATASGAITCYGSTSTLTLTSSYAVGVGYNYQWQVSADSGNTYSNIAYANASSYVASTSLPQYYVYRCNISCVNTGTSVTTSSTQTVTSPVPLAAGTYTINSGSATSGTNYNTLTAAITDLNCKGIAGPVTFNFTTASGTVYSEQVVLNQVVGANATNRITINGNSNLLTFSQGGVTTTNRGGFTFNGADYVTLKNLNIDATGGGNLLGTSTTNTLGYCVQITNDANYDSVSNCTLVASISSTTIGNQYPVVFSTVATGAAASTGTVYVGSNNVITGNVIFGGYAGVMLQASTSSATYYGNNNVVSNNTIKDFYTNAINLTGQKFATVSKNDIFRTGVRGTTSGSVAATVGVNISTTNGEGITIRNNAMHNVFDGITAKSHTNGFTGVNITGSTNTASAYCNVINNTIYKIVGSGSYVGITMSPAYVKAYHNTIVFDNDTATTTATTYGIQLSSSVGIYDVRNNIVHITRGSANTATGSKSCLYIVTIPNNTTNPYTNFTIDYNNYYQSCSNCGSNNYLITYNSSTNGITSASGLPTWRNLGYGYDANSLNIDPAFVNASTDVTPTNGAIDDMGVSVGVTTDINNNNRNASLPDMGAIEWASSPCTDPPTPGAASASVTVACSTTNITLDVIGGTNGSGQSTQWQYSTDNSNWNNLTTARKATSYTTTQSVTTYYRAEIVCSGGIPAYTNTVTVTTPTAISGTYTINKNAAASGSNFQSFTAALNAIYCGISGPVVFNVVTNSGPYNEQISIGSIPGASATNTITFNGNRNRLYFNATNSNARHTVQLNGAKYVTFDNLIIEGKGTSTDAGIGVHFAAGSSYNTISNCKVDAGANTTTTNHAAIWMSNTQVSSTFPVSTGTTLANAISYNTITNDTLIGGNYAIGASSGTSAAIGKKNAFTNNVIRDFYGYGILIQNQDSATISGNELSRPTRLTNATNQAAGIYIYNVCTNSVVDRNRIHDLYAKDLANTGSCYPLQNGPSTGATSGNENTISNNLVYSIKSNSGSKYGVYIQSTYLNVYNNTIILDDNTAANTSAVVGIYFGVTNNLKVKNNLFYITHLGSGTKRNVQLGNGTLLSTVSMDYNEFYMNVPSGNGTATFGQNTLPAKTYTDLASWKTDSANSANAIDQNSLSSFIAFKSASTGDYTPTAKISFNNTGTPIATVTTDINGTTRSATTPDIGAYEFDIVACTGTPSGGTAFASTASACIGTDFAVDVTGQSSGLGIVHQWQSATSVNGTWSDVGVSLQDTSASLTISQTADNYYRLKTTCTNSGQVAYSSSVLVLTPQYVSGTFTIDSAYATDISQNNFQSFTDAINYISCGVNGPVVFNVATGSVCRDQITIPAITGTSATNTITFNGNGVQFLIAPVASTSRTAITLYGADWVRLNNFNIDLSSSTQGGIGIIMGYGANNNIINGCTINASENTTVTTGSTTFYGISISGTSSGSPSANTTGSNGSYNTINNCNIKGGNIGIYMQGPTISSGVMDSGNVVSNCQITDAYSVFVDVNRQYGAIYSGNNLYRTSNRTTYGNGNTHYIFRAQGSTVNCLYEKNKLHDFFVTDVTANGVLYCFYNAASNSGITYTGNDTMNKYHNNLCYNLYYQGNTIPFFMTSATNYQLYHNTVVLDGTGPNGAGWNGGQTYGIQVLGSSIKGVDIRNNNIYISRFGTSIKRCILLNPTSTVGTNPIISNNNNFYFNGTGGTDNNLGQYTTVTYATLANWQTANSNAYDQNSSSVDPNFANANAANYAPTNTALNTVGATNLGVTTDILNNLRTTFFYPGCYESDNQPPSFTNATALTCTSSSSSAVLTGVIIADDNGVPTTGANIPRIYFRKGTGGSWSNTAGSLTSGNSLSGTWSFTMDYSTLGGVNPGDLVQYFVVAQDNFSTANVGASVTGVTATNVNTILVYPSAPSSFTRAVTPTVTISTDTTGVCSGNSVTFEATGTNTGSSPVFQWKKNNANFTTGSSVIFPPNSLNNNDLITCELTSNNSCQTTNIAFSNLLFMTVKSSPASATITSQYSTNTTSLAMCTFGSVVSLYPSLADGVWSSSNQSVATVARVNATSYSANVTAIANGTATLTYTLTTPNTTCSTVSTVLVKVSKQNTPAAITGSSSLCVASNTTYTTTDVDGVWSTAGRATINATTGVATGVAAGSTTILYTKTNSDGCSASSTKAITVNAQPATPTVSYAPGTTGISGSGGFCRNKTFTVVGKPSNGVWSKTGSGISISPANTVSTTTVVTTAATAGSAVITYTYTDANGCSNFRSTSMTISASCKGVAANTSAIDNVNFVLYPNPARSIVSLNIKALVGSGSIIVTDLYGKQLKQQPLSMGINNIDVNGLAKGMYLVSVITEEGKSTKKLIVE